MTKETPSHILQHFINHAHAINIEHLPRFWTILAKNGLLQAPGLQLMYARGSIFDRKSIDVAYVCIFGHFYVKLIFKG